MTRRLPQAAGLALGPRLSHQQSSLWGDEPRVVVTIARPLHRRGVRSIVAALNGPHFPLSSRAIAGVTRIGGTADDSAQLLCLLARSEGAAWVVPTSDSSLRVVCAAYDTLSRFCAVGCPPPHVVQRVLDKALTLEAAETVGVPIPTSLTIATAGDLDAILPRMQFPIIAKPSDKSQSTKHGFKKRTFKSSAELRHAFAAQSDFGSGLLFQTFHGGQGVGVEVLISRGQLVASFQHRRLSENPPSGGVAVVGIAEPVDPVLLGYAVRLLTALEWDGVAMVEFRHDPLTGEAVLMEVNGRFWGSLALAVAAGVDFPWYAWKASQSLPQEAQEPYRHGLRVCWTAGSLRRFAHAISKSDERTSIGAAITQLLADFRPGTRSALWAWSDPAPAMQDVAGLLREWSKEFIKRGIRAAVPSAALSIVSSARMLPADRRGVYMKRRIARLIGTERAVALPANTRSVLFVCHGNIMRSASAERFLQEDLETLGIADIRVSSAGTHARAGREADARVRRALAHLGVSLDGHRATPLTADLVASHDVIFAMDELNYVNILAEFPQSKARLRMLGGMSPAGMYHPHEIADPYTTGPEGVASTIREVRSCVAALSQVLANELALATPHRHMEQQQQPS